MTETTQVIEVDITCPFCSTDGNYQVLVGDSTFITCIGCEHALTIVTRLKIEVIAEVM